MKLISSNKTDTNRVELVIEIDGETFMKAVNAVYKKQVKSITIPGFRKGKAPRSIIEREYGEGVFYDDALKEVYPAAIAEAAAEAGIEMVKDNIDVDVEKAGKDGVIFKAVVTVEPEVEIEGYKGLTYKPMSVEITDEDVDKEIQRVLDRNSRLVKVEDREAQPGDTAVIDFKGLLDGVAFEGGTAENYSLVLGSGSFIPGFEEQVAGHKTGEEFTIDVTFPEDYQEETLKGKAVQFEIKLHEIKTKEIPELDDDYVKDISEFDTVEAYKSDLREKLEKDRQEEAESDKERQLADKLRELMKAEVPEAMYNNQVDNLVDDFAMHFRSHGIEFAMHLRSQGIDLRTYMQYTGLTEEKLRETYHDRAVSQVEVRLALKKIAALEGIKATDEDVEKKYAELAENYSVEVDRVKAVFPASDIAADLNVEKALELVKEAAVAAGE